MSEEKKIIEINDENLQEVTGGNGDKPACPYYKNRNTYNTCPTPLKGKCQQCGNCELNVD